MSAARAATGADEGRVLAPQCDELGTDSFEEAQQASLIIAAAEQASAACTDDVPARATRSDAPPSREDRTPGSRREESRL